VMESRSPRSIRYSDPEWQPFVESGLLRDIEPSTLARDCSFIGLTVLLTPALMEAFVRVTASVAPSKRVIPASHANGHGGKA
jgi:hypothetical protein